MLIDKAITADVIEATEPLMDNPARVKVAGQNGSAPVDQTVRMTGTTVPAANPNPLPTQGADVGGATRVACPTAPEAVQGQEAEPMDTFQSINAESLIQHAADKTRAMRERQAKAQLPQQDSSEDEEVSPKGSLQDSEAESEYEPEGDQTETDQQFAQKVQEGLDHGEDSLNAEVARADEAARVAVVELAAHNHALALTNEAEQLMEGAKAAQDLAFMQDAVEMTGESDGQAQERHAWYQAAATEARDKAVEATTALRLARSKHIQMLSAADKTTHSNFGQAKKPVPEKELEPFNSSLEVKRLYASEEAIDNLRKRRSYAHERIIKAQFVMIEITAQFKANKSRTNQDRLKAAQRQLKSAYKRYENCCNAVNAKTALEDLQDCQSDLPAPQKQPKIADKIRRAEKQCATERTRELTAGRKEKVWAKKTGQTRKQKVWMARRQKERLSTAMRRIAAGLIEINFGTGQAREIAIKVALQMPDDVTPDTLKKFLYEEEQTAVRCKEAATRSMVRAASVVEKELHALRTERDVQEALSALRVLTQEENQTLKRSRSWEAHGLGGGLGA